MNNSSEQRTDIAILAVITLAAAWLRLAFIGQPSLWWDEFITVGASLKPLPDMLAVLKYLGPSDIGTELFPPFQHVITHFLLSFGHSDVLMRLPGVLAGVATVPAAYLLCRRPLGRLTAHAAALALALSVYHIHFSREVRPYSLFMLENLLALHFLHAALTQDRRGLLPAWGVCLAAMLYTSYMAATLIFAQALFAGSFLLTRALGGRKRESLALALRCGLTLMAAGIVYLPWARGQLNVFAYLHDPSFKPPFNLDFITSSLREFSAFAYTGDLATGWPLAALGLLGCILALRPGRLAFALLMTVWAFMPVAGIFLAKAHMDLSSRYIFPLYFFLILFAAHVVARAVDALAGRLAAGSQPIFFARLVMATTLVAALSGPNIMSYRDYYSRETSHFKELIASLIENRENHDEVVFFVPRNLKLIHDWYGQDMLPAPRDISGGGYHRAFLLTPHSVDLKDKFPLTVPRATIKDSDVLSLGIARTPVRPMIPDARGRYVYSENFSGFRMFEDAFASVNMAPSPLTKTLMARDAGEAAWCAYRFQAPRGACVDGAKLTVTFSTRLSGDLPSDARDTLSITPAGKPPVPLAIVTLDSFRGPDGKLVAPNHEKKRFITLTFDLAKELAGADSFDLRLDYAAFTSSYSIEAEDFQIEADLSGPASSADELPGALIDQLPVVRWTPNEDLALSGALHAFSLDGGTIRPAVNPSTDLNAYLLAHPGDKPVRILNRLDGSPAVALYDPALRTPTLHLVSGPGRQLTALPATKREVRSFRLAGRLDAPSLTIGTFTLPLPVSCPDPAELTVNPGGRGQVVFSPLFTTDALDFSAMASKENIRKNDGEACLSCAENRPCQLTYAIRSGLPLTGLRITAFPRVFSDPDSRNSVRTLVSTDGRSWRTVNTSESMGTGLWEAMQTPQYTRIKLKDPASQVLVRFELAGPKCQLWSGPDTRMRIEADLDASSVPIPVIGSWPARLAVSNATPLEVFVSDRPHIFPDRLLRTR